MLAMKFLLVALLLAGCGSQAVETPRPDNISSPLTNEQLAQWHAQQKFYTLLCDRSPLEPRRYCVADS
jgi:hypothetical protein